MITIIVALTNKHIILYFFISKAYLHRFCQNIVISTYYYLLPYRKNILDKTCTLQQVSLIGVKIEHMSTCVELDIIKDMLVGHWDVYFDLEA